MKRGLVLLAIVAVACAGTQTAQAPSAAPITSPTQTPQPALWRTVPAPTGAPSGSEWIAVDTFDGKALIASVRRSAQTGPAPVAILLHADDGLNLQFLEFVSGFAKAGFLTVTPCWAKGPDPLGCSANAPARASAADLVKDVMAVTDAARTLPGARADRTALVGYSGGAQAAVLVGSMGGKVDAVVAISAGYGLMIRQRWGTSLPDQLDGLRVPLLIVHGTGDLQQPGTHIDLVRAFEKTARDKGKNVEALYVEGAPHTLPYLPQYWTEEVQGKVIAFLKRHPS